MAGSKVTYAANYRLTTRPYALSWASGGAALKQHATIYHANTAVKTVRIISATVFLKNVSAAATVMIELRRLSLTTAPATGNPAITPIAHYPGSAAAETTCLALPTTAGSEAGANQGWGAFEQARGITAAASVINPPPNQVVINLYEANQDTEPLIIRALNAEGYAIIIDASASATILSTCQITFTEE